MYPIYQENLDYIFEADDTPVMKGTRAKKLVIDPKTNEKAYFKYQLYNVSESCSEKMCYEISKILGYSCAHIELAKDKKGNVGVLNYLFIDIEKEAHHDAVDFMNKNNSDMREYHTIDNIKKCLDKIDKKMFDSFLKIMIFDSLVGETDRHSENWGIIESKAGYRLSPLYDNGTNLLREFRNEEFAEKFYSGQKDFKAFINNAKSWIYNEDGKRYKLFDLIRKLYLKFPKQITSEINNLKKLTDDKIMEIVNNIPCELLTQKHKEKIIEYLIIRRNILESIIK